MNKINVLDCTLRDGGYCNNWTFGKNNIQKIINGLIEADIDIIECGYITNRIPYHEDSSQYDTVERVSSLLPQENGNKLFVGMIDYGKYNPKDLPICDTVALDGIRVTFHKKDMVSALEFCKEIQDRGYKVFIQAMVSLSYSDEEFLDMIRRVNKLNPYAFYIVDSFGVMKQKDLIRLFYLVEHNLNEEILIGYHSHNNMQLAYSNAQVLVDMKTKHQIIIDSSIFGMGRGAGNLNTELFVQYLNDNFDTGYQLKPLLNIIDEILNSFYQQNYWGYSLPNYLSAKYNTHPNYAGYLDDKKTLTVEAMDEIFSMMDDSKRASYDKKYMEELYVQYMTSGYVQETHHVDLKSKIENNDILIIAPGRSSLDEKDRIISLAKKSNIITFSINFDYSEYDTDFIFLSNLRRFRELDEVKREKCIVTSNIPSVNVYLQTKYKDLINKEEMVSDNAGMMLIKYLIQMGAKKILIAGIDGYSVDPSKNFMDSKMNFYAQKATFEAMNKGMEKVLKEYSELVDIEYVTTQKYVHLNNTNNS